MKKTYFAVLGLLLLLTACTTGTGSVETQSDSHDSSGRVVFAITDAAADMGTVSSVKVTVESIQIHSDAKGWITLSDNEQTYDLLELKAQNKNELLADVTLENGNYSQIRLEISKVEVTDAEGTHSAKLPSNELKINSKLEVEGNSTSAVTLDFKADESLHIANEQYIMAPVIKIETRQDADVDVQGSSVKISGKVSSSTEVGMDANGNIGVGIKLPKNANISIEAGNIKLDTKAQGKVQVGLG